MRKKYFSITCLAALLLSLASCDSYFDDFFEIKRPQETQWTTTATFEQGLNKCYYNMQWTFAGGRGWPQFTDFLTSGTAVAIPGNTPGIGGEQLLYRKFTDRLSQFNDVWSGCYNTITLSNLALDLNDRGNGNPFNLAVNGDDYRHNYLRQVGEYHFARAYSYFFLVKQFAPKYKHNGDNNTPAIPFKVHAAYSKEDVLNEKIGTVEDIYQLIIEDLKYAKENLPDKFTLNSWNNVPGYEAGRANKWTSSALLGKVYFLMGKYAEAKAEFDDLINYSETTGNYSLEAPKDPFNKERAEEFPKESIWEFNGGFLDGQFERHNNYMYAGMVMGLRFRDSNGDELFSSPVNNVGTVISSWAGVVIAYTAIKEMGWMNDPINGDYTVTPAAQADLRYQQVYHLMLPYKPGIKKGDPEYITTESLSGHSQVTSPTLYIDKFFRGAAPYGKFSKFPLIRLADIYLLRAWLKLNENNLTGTADDLNIVWNRSNPGNLNVYSATNVNHAAIYKEYLREMTGEGWTVDFMMGTQMTIPKGDSDLNTTIEPPYAGWYWPIPTTEIDLNPNYK